ncbi:MAG TPA: phosphoribosyltransferase family protein [Acidimicrobiia bacterium]|nr:phosphoribosyltransferase family protein [Acidimicrobiia bacterium]
MDRPPVFVDRADAGRHLAEALRGVGDRPVVAGIPRGGVVVAADVAAALGAPLRAVVARKVGAPGHPELALGAVGPDGVAVIDQALVARVGASDRFVAGAVAEARAQVEARRRALPGVLHADDVSGRTVVVVDDGVATGATAAAVGRWLATTDATRRVLGLPVGPDDTVARLDDDYDEVVTLLVVPAGGFYAVGPWYRDFRQVTDDEVAALLTR